MPRTAQTAKALRNNLTDLRNAIKSGDVNDIDTALAEMERLTKAIAAEEAKPSVLRTGESS